MKQLFRRRSRSAQSQDRRKKFLRGDVSRRTLRCEHLEDRALMASDMFVSDHWNYRQPLDVNSDRIVTPLDALLVINELNGRGPRQLSAAAPSLAMSAGGSSAEGESAAAPKYVDVNNDGFLTPLDALVVINALNAEGESGNLVEYELKVVAAGASKDSPALTSIPKGGEYDLVTLIRDTSPDLGRNNGPFAGYLDVAYDQSKTEISVSEKLQLKINGTPAAGGTFTLTFNGQQTAAITFSTSASVTAGRIRDALLNLSNIGATDVEVVADPVTFRAWQIRFVGALADMDFPENALVSDASNLGAGTSIAITTIANGTITDPNAISEAFGPIPDADGVLYFGFGAESAFRQPGRMDDVGSTGLEFPKPFTQQVELWRVRMNANEGGFVLFTPDVVNVLHPFRDTLLRSDDPPDDETSQITIPPSQITTIGTGINIVELVSAVADSPASTPSTPILLENSGSVTLSPLANDLTTTAGSLRLTALGTGSNGGTIQANGTLGIAGTTTVQYTPAPDFFGDETFTYTIGDGLGNFDTNTVTVRVTGVNDAPTIVVPLATQTVNEGASRTFSAANGNAIVVADVDAAAQNVQVTLTTSGGNLAINPTANLTGITVMGNGTGAVTITGPIGNAAAGVNAVMDGLVYTPTAEFSATGSTTIGVSVSDLGNTANGVPGAPLTANATINVTVVGSNDAPVNTVPGAQSVLEEGSLIFSTANSNAILVADVDANVNGSAFPLAITLAVTPGSGTLTLGSTAGLSGVAGNGSATVTFNGTASAVNTALQGLTFTSTSMQVGAKTLTITTDDQGNSGTGGARNDSDVIDINVIPLVRPVALPDPFTVDEDSVLGTAANRFNVLGNDLANLPDGNEPPGGYKPILLDITNPANTTPPANGTITLFDNGTPADATDDRIDYVPNANFFGTDTFTYTVTDAKVGSAPSATTVTVTVTNVNDAPTATPVAGAATEDTTLTLTAANFGFSDPTDLGAHSLLAVKVTTLPSAAHGTLVNDGDLVVAGDFISIADINAGNFKFVPADNNVASASFTFQVQDNGGTLGGGIDLDQSADTLTINIAAVNDPPSFVKGADQTALEDAGPQSVAWATAISAGPSDEAGQTLTFQVTGNTNPGLFSVAPAISSTGVLTYTPTANASGSATISVTLSDNGGGANTSAVQTFAINVTPVNDAPAGANVTLNAVEDLALTFVAANFGFSDPTDLQAHSLAAVTVTTLPSPAVGVLTSNNVAVTAGQSIPVAEINAGRFKFVPAQHLNGSAAAAFTFQVQDSGGIANGGIDLDPTPRTVGFSIAAVNDAPSFTLASPTVTIVEDAGAQALASFATSISAGPADEAGQSVSFQVTSNSNSSLFSVAPAISSTGQLTFTSAANANGSATIAVVLQDNGGGTSTSAAQTFTINVTAVNDEPVANNDGVPTPIRMIKDRVNQVVSNLLSNDTDVEGSALVISRLPGTVDVDGSTLTANGRVRIGVDGRTVLYTPNSGFIGTDTFTYFAKEEISGLESLTAATVNLNVVNSIPTNVSGVVFMDGSTTSGVGVLSAGDTRLANVQLTLTGKDLDGNNVSRSAVTDSNGFYLFVDVEPSLEGQPYVLQQIQPLGMRDGSESAGGSFATANGNDRFLIELPLLGIAGGANNTNFAELGIDPGQLTNPGGLVAEMIGSSSSNNGSVIAIDAAGNASWYYSLNNWAALPNLRIVLDPVESAATLHYTTATGPKTLRIYQDPADPRNTGRVNGTSMARFRIISDMTTGGGCLIRLDGTLAEFGISLASAQLPEGEGEAAMADADFSRNADAVFAEQSWA